MEPQMVVRIMANIDGLREALAQGGSAIQNTTAGMQRMVASFSGDKLIQQAVNMAAAIDKIGGASKLTEAELARANAVFERAAEKMTALGSEGAAAMQKLAESTRAVTPPMQQAQAATQSWASSFSSMLAGFLSAQAIWSTVTAGLNLIVSALGAVKDALVGAVLGTAALGDEMLVLANKTGISVERLSAWRYIAGQTGTSLEQITGAVFKLQTELGEGGTKTAQALNAIGLSVAQLRAQRPDEAFESVLSKLRQLPSESEKASVGVALFGKGFKDMANLTREDIDGMMSRFKELGGTISTELAVAGDAFNDARADWGVLVERINTSIGAAILPAATAFVNIMVDAVKKTLDESGVSAAQFQASISNAFAAVVDVSGLVLQAIGLLIQGFAELFTGKWTRETAGLVSAIGLVGTNISGLGQTVALFNGQAGLAGMFEKLKAGFVETMRISTQVAIAGRESERVLVALGQNMASVGEQIKGKGAAALQAVQEQIRASAEAMRNAAATASSGVGLFSDALGQMGRQIDFSDQKLQALVPRIQAVILPLARLREGGVETSRAFTDLNRTLGIEMDAAMRRATVASQMATERMAQFRAQGQGATQTTEDMTASTNELGLAFDLAGQFVSVFGSELGVLGQVLNTAIGMVSQYASALNAAKQAGENTAKAQTIMNGAINALATGGMMASIQVGLSLKAHYDQIEAAALAVAEQLAGMNEELQAQYGSFEEARKAAERYGLELDEVRNKFIAITAAGTARAGYRNDTDEDRMRRFQDQVESLDDRVKLAQESIERYNLEWTDMPNIEDRLRMAITAARDLELTFRTLVQTGFDVSAVVRGMSDDINDWLNQALRAGVAIPEAMRPMLEALIRAGEISEENARLLLGLADSGVPSLEAVTAAAERYGIALEDLGPKVQQLQIDEAAQQLVDDWNVLSAATEDWGVLFESMGPKVQSLIDDAIRYGAELPAAMKPMLQAFIDAGELVDENGNKLTDLSQLNFAEDLSAMVEQLIGKLDELINTIVGGVAPAFASIGTAAQSGFKAATDAAVTSYDQTKSRFAEGYTEVIGQIDWLEDRLRALPDEEINIVTTGVEDAKEKIEDLTRTAENVPKQVRIDIDAGDIEAAGYKTIQQLEEIARRAGVIYAEMARSGKFNASELERAFKAWQTALNNINPEPLSRAAAAGYQTRDALMAAAKESESLWREMVASGLYTTETLQRAWEDWQDDLAAAGMGGMSRAIRRELEDLQRYVESELPEFNELGERIFGVEEQRAIDRIKEIESQAKAAQEAMEGTAESAGVTISNTGEAVAIDMEKQAKGTILEVERMGSEGEAAFQEMEISAEEARRKLLEVEGQIGDIQTMLDAADYGEAFRNARQDVEDLIDAINDIPDWSGSGGSRGMADYAYRTASNDTLGPSVAYRSVPLAPSDSRIVASLDRLSRQLTNQQPDIMIVPMVTGNVDEFESRMAEAMPRRVTRSANLRNAWQRAVNGAAGG